MQGIGGKVSILCDEARVVKKLAMFNCFCLLLVVLATLGSLFTVIVGKVTFPVVDVFIEYPNILI